MDPDTIKSTKKVIFILLTFTFFILLSYFSNRTTLKSFVLTTGVPISKVIQGSEEFWNRVVLNIKGI